MSASTETSVSRQVNVRLPKDLAEKLEEVRTNGPYEISKSKIVRTALEEHLEQRA